MSSGDAEAKPQAAWNAFQTSCAQQVLARSLTVGLALVVAIAGCAPGFQETTDSRGAQSSAAVSGDEQAVTLRVADAAGFQEALDRHRGKVVLVDFWATWCGPCLEQFPHTVKLANKLRERGLAVVSVSMDNPTAEPQVRAFLEQQQAQFDNLLSRYSSPVTATKEFGLPGPVPCYRIYDREGRMYREFRVDPRAAKQFTTADIDAAVEEVL